MNLTKVLTAMLLVVAMVFTSSIGCGNDTKPMTPEKKEEQRQKMIKNAERQRREG